MNDRLNHNWFPILPTVYGEELSYLEDISKLLELVDGYKEEVAKLREEILGLVEDRLDEYSKELQAKLDAFQKQIDDLIAEVESLVDELKKIIGDFKIQVNEELEKQKAWVQTQIAILTASVNSQIKTLKLYVDQLNEETRNYVDVEIQKVIDMIPDITTTMVISPFTGKLVKIQTYIDEAGNYYTNHSLTLLEYDSANLSMAEYDSYNFSFWEYNNRAWLYFNTWNQFEGKKTSAQIFMDDLFSLHSGDGVSIAEYAAFNLNTAEYANKNIVLIDYALHAKTLLTA